MVARGRSCVGDKHPQAVVTSADVETIRELRGKVGQKELAARYGIHETTIREIQIGKAWGHLPNADDRRHVRAPNTKREFCKLDAEKVLQLRALYASIAGIVWHKTIGAACPRF